ncbi:MAG: peptidoglycan DD-metalloendopeptidase family protein [Minisyncoccia bacterium]
MKKAILISSLLFLTSPLITLAATPSELEQQIDQVRRDREVLLEEQKKLQAELEATNKESQSLGSAVKSLDTTKKKLTKDISITQSRITSTDLTIKSLEGTMSEKEQQIATHRRAIADTLLSLSQYDTRPLMLSLLSSVGLSDLWRDRTQLENLSTRLDEEIDALRETRKILGLEKVEKEKVKVEQTSLKGQLSGQKSAVEENQKAKEKLLAETKNKEAEYQKLLADNLARQKQFEDDLSRLETELRITLDPSLIPSARHSVLSWPLDKIFVTDPFGYLKERYHNGVDFRASVGTPVKAPLSGVVKGAGNTDEMNAQYRKAGKPACVSYGRWILIDHGNGLSSVYAHLSASLVKTGQSVKTGEIIGYSGGAYGANGSGYSFGPHLHMGLLASQGVEVRQLTNSKGGCKEIFMPIALGTNAYLDPLVYLPTL